MAAPSASSASAGPRRQSRLPPRAAWRTSSAAWRASSRRAGGGLAGERERMAGGRRASGRDAREKRQETAGKGPRVASRAGPRAFFACAGSPSAPQGAGFGLGPPAPVLARAGEKRASGGATGAFFWRRRGKIAWGGPVGGAAGDALRTGTKGGGFSNDPLVLVPEPGLKALMNRD